MRPNSSGVLGAACAPIRARRSVTSGMVSTAAISLLSFAMIAPGVAGGAKRPSHEVTLYPGTPPSLRVGTLGRGGERGVLVPAIGRSRPACTYPSTEGSPADTT